MLPTIEERVSKLEVEIRLLQDLEAYVAGLRHMLDESSDEEYTLSDEIQRQPNKRPRPHVPGRHDRREGQ